MDPAALIEPVGELVRKVAEAEVVSRFGRLVAAEIDRKAGDEVVTAADTAAERALFDGLAALVPEALLVGEEAVAADPELLARARSAEVAFVVDPVDGTANFVAGSPDFAVMVACIVAGETVAAWIHQPVHDRLYTASVGGGAQVDGQPLRRVPAAPEVARLRGVLRTWALGPERGPEVQARGAAFAVTGDGRLAAGIEYPRVATGDLDFVFWWRNRVWDHAPGALLLTEAGGFAGHLDGSPYRPWSDREGLIVAADPATHERVRAILAPGGHP